MAIKPISILQLSNVALSDDEEVLLNKIETDIDKQLQINFSLNEYASFIVDEDLSLAAKRELIRRYREAGWHVLALESPAGSSTVLYCTQNHSHSGDAAQRLNGEH